MNDRQIYYIQNALDTNESIITSIIKEWRNTDNELCEYAEELEAYRMVSDKIKELLT